MADEDTYRYVGTVDGLPRVWGCGDTPDEAYRACVTAVMNYLVRRPDTGPLSKWLIEEE